MPKTQAPYIVVADVESGGLPSKDKLAFHKIALVEIAAVVIDVEKLEIVEEISWLIKPYQDDLEYSEGAFSVHGISKKMLEEKGEDLKVVYKNFKDILKKYKSGRWKPVIAGHNFEKFDIPFIQGMFGTFKDDIFEHIQGTEDTLRWSSYKWKESTNYKLGTVCSNMGVELTEAHRALRDTVANAELIIKFIQLLRSETIQKEDRFRDNFKMDIKFDKF